jgi:hypothetical protein
VQLHLCNNELGGDDEWGLLQLAAITDLTMRLCIEQGLDLTVSKFSGSDLIVAPLFKGVFADIGSGCLETPPVHCYNRATVKFESVFQCSFNDRQREETNLNRGLQVAEYTSAHPPKFLSMNLLCDAAEVLELDEVSYTTRVRAADVTCQYVIAAKSQRKLQNILALCMLTHDRLGAQAPWQARSMLKPREISQLIWGHLYAEFHEPDPPYDDGGLE